MEDTLWVYLHSESNLWTVGFYEPSGKWQPESDHGSPEEAARRVHFLNGGDETCGQPDRDARILAESNIELVAALKAALPNLEWANIHGSRCEEILSQVKAAIAKAES